MTSCFSSTERLHTVHATYRLPELPCAQVNRTGKLPPNSPNLHAIDYSLWGVATDGVLSQNFRSRHDASHRRSRRWDIPYLESDVSKRSHVAKTVSSCFAVLRQLRSIRRSVSRSVLQSLVSSLVFPRLDYDNAAVAGIPSSSVTAPVSDELCCSPRSFLLRGSTTSLRSFASSTGLGLQSGLLSSVPSLCINAFTGLQRRTSSMNCVKWQM